MRLLQAFVIAGLLGLGVIAPAAAQDSGSVDLDALRNGGTGRVLVTLRAPDEGSAITPETIRRTVLDRHFQGAMAEIGEPDEIAITHLYDDPLRFAADVDFRALNALRNDPNVDAVEPDRWMRPAMLEIGEAVRAPILHAEGIDGSGVVIVQFDTGVDTDHPFIAANLEDGLCFSTPREGGTSLCPGGAASAEGPGAAEACTDLPECAHGTQTAGIMVGSGGEMRGVAPGARLLPIQVFTRMEGSDFCPDDNPCLVAWHSDLVAALNTIHVRYRDNRGEVGAFFFGFSDMPHQAADWPSDDPETLCNASIYDNQLQSSWTYPYVIPTGNEGTTHYHVGPPCTWREFYLLTQSETGDGQISSFSNTWLHDLGDDVSIRNVFGTPAFAAPGENIPTSTIGSTGYAEVTGTSAAAAQMAGVVALLRSVYPYPQRTIWNAVRHSGRWINDPRMNYDVTLVRADAALDWLDRSTLGDFRIGGSIFESHRWLDVGMGTDMVFVGPAGGPFRVEGDYSQLGDRYEVHLDSGRNGVNEGLPISTAASVPWLSIDAPSETPQRHTRIYTGPNSAATALAPGLHRAEVSFTIGDFRPMRRNVFIAVGSPNTTLDQAYTLSGESDYSFGYYLDAAVDPDSAALGLDHRFPVIWWQWTAPRDGEFLVRARELDPLSGDKYHVRVFEGASSEALAPVEVAERCISRWRNNTNGTYRRFTAEAGTTYSFAVQATLINANFPVASIQVFPAQVTGYETQETARPISGSDINMLLALHGTDARCDIRPFGAELAHYAGNGDAWLMWTPDETGRHAFRINVRNQLEGNAYLPRDGFVSIYDETGATLLARHESSYEMRQDDYFDSFVNVVAGERYLIHVDASGVFGTVLEIRPPDESAPPQNDDFANATEVVLPMSSYSGENRFATREEAAADTEGAGRSLWWRFTPDVDGSAYVTTVGTITGVNLSELLDLNIWIYRGASPQSLQPVVTGTQLAALRHWSVDHNEAYFPIEAGEVYHVRLDNLPRGVPAAEPFPYRLTISAGSPPANDNFADAIEIGFDEWIEGENRFATQEPGEPVPDGASDIMAVREELGVWYHWIAPATGRYRMNAYSSFINPQIWIYTGDALETLTLAAGNSHSGGPPPALSPFRYDFDAVGGTRYAIRVSSYQRQMGDFRFRITPGGPLNDHQDRAISIGPFQEEPGSPYTPFTHTVDNTYATNVPETSGTAAADPNTSVWYSSGIYAWMDPYVVSTSGSAVDTHIRVMDLNGDEVVSNDDLAAGLTSSEVVIQNLTYNGVRIEITTPDDQRGPIRVNAGWNDQTHPRLRGATLPYARSGVVGQPITGFATLLNNGYRAGLDCGLALADPSQPFDFEFRPTDPSTNAIDGAAGETRPADVLRPVTYLFALTPREPVAAREVALTYACSNADNAPSVAGVNTVLISADTTQQPDILSIGTTASNDGVIRIPSTSGVGFLSTAALNLGSTGEITFSADVTGTDIPVTIEVCETDLSNGGACRTPRAAQTTVSFGAGEVKTFAVFVRANGAVAFDPAGVRVFARWRDEGGVVRGATSAAVRTP
ncbi:S8 family peptidase [Hyphobacterium sp. SN044]|uniref:S8 family peptidase n=1 Tax=Hyphobacterium sp. SN044 TaxID=2912575 RepID=UPI001F267776|nr:S8 family serine peptidase [Hyphobacterium sp. SN044]MCF8880955.1 S8 family peptidase [Hyphobacterium sp. SN044]